MTGVRRLNLVVVTVGLVAAITAAAGATNGTSIKAAPGESAPSELQLPRSSMHEGQARYFAVNGVDLDSAIVAKRLTNRTVSVAHGSGRTCIADSAGSAMCSDSEEIEAGRAIGFLMCAPGMATGELRITGIAPGGVTSAELYGRAGAVSVEKGVFALAAEVPSAGVAELRVLLRGAREMTAIVPLPPDLASRPCE